MKNKRGQITMFIILGIIILFAVGFTIYMVQKPDFRLTPKEETPIETYVRLCIEDTAERGIRLLGVQGGYINLPANIEKNPNAYLSYIPFGQPRIPYWYYQGKSRIPTQEFMQSEIGTYVAEHIDDCINDFEPFKNEYDITITGNVTGDSTIGKESVLVKLNYPLEIRDKVKGTLLEIEDFSGEVLVRLGRMYGLAKEIMRAENEQMYFENITIDLMTMSPNLPFTGFEFGSCAPTIWRKSKLIEEIKDILHYHIPRIKVEQTTFEIKFGKFEKYEQKHFIWDVTQKKYKDLRVGFKYLKDWDIEMHIRPNDREILRSNAARGPVSLLPFLCMNTYHFTYDVIYPIEVIIKDEESFDGEGFVFNYAFPVLINHNEGDRTDFPITMYASPELSYGFCNAVTDQTFDIRVKDFYTYEELKGANVSFRCLKFICNLGATKADVGSYRLRTELPRSCTGGELVVSKEGYLEEIEVHRGEEFKEVFMKPLKKFNVSVQLHRSTDFSVNNNFRDDYSAFITLENEVDGHEIYLAYPMEEEQREIELVYGDAVYDVDILLVVNDEVIRGGYQGKLVTSYSSMRDANDLILPIVEIIPTPITEQEQMDAMQYIDENQEYKTTLLPRFS